MFEDFLHKVLGVEEEPVVNPEKRDRLDFSARVDAVLLYQMLLEAGVRGANVESGREGGVVHFFACYRKKVEEILSDLGRPSYH